MGRLRLKRPDRPKKQKPKRPALSPAVRAQAGIAAGGGMTSLGLGLWFGLPVALVAAGLGVVAFFLFLVDADEPDRDGDRPW